MKRVKFVFISDDGENSVVHYDAVLIRDNTIMYRYRKEKKIAIEQSDRPYKVDTDSCAYEAGKITGVLEIELSDEGYALDLEKLASMTFADLTKYLKLGGW